jgi:hypothetical protein
VRHNRLGVTRPELRVFSYRRGVLSSLAHDLQLTLSRFRLELDAARVSARFDLRCIEVDGAIVRGRLDGRALSAAQKQEIQGVLSREIFHCQAHPEAILTGSVARTGDREFVFTGELSLNGRVNAIEATLEAGPCMRVAVELTPSRWGIAPYKALGGLLRLHDRVSVLLSLPTDVPGFDLDSWQVARCSWSMP